jgi:glycosyltransferase involved in cell wall biosynthesis
MKKSVSVVIPTYNYSNFVCKAIDSVLNQTYSPIECIVVNDGSTDNTMEVLKLYEGKIHIIDQINGGLSNARNSGIKAASGEYISFLDSDDWWEINKIEQQVDYLDNHPDVNAIGCGIYDIDKSRNECHIQISINPSDDPSKNLQDVALRRLWIGGSGSGIFARRFIFDEIGLFDEALSAAEDWDMWLRIVSQYKIYNLPEPLTTILRHGTGVFRNVERMEKNQWAVYNKAIQKWPDILNPYIRRKMRALILSDAGGEYVSSKKLKDARYKYYKSLTEWPFDYRIFYKLIRIQMKLTSEVMTKPK